MMMWVRDQGTFFAIFCLFIVKGTSQEKPVTEILGLAEEAFDDQYLGCRQAMERELEAKEVLTAERNKSKWFRRAWDEAEKRWKTKTKECVTSIIPEGFHDYHGVALVAYSGFIKKDFNKAVQSAGKSYRNYMDNFHYKALHYYLTVALQLLMKSCKDNSNLLYRGFDNVFYKVPKGTSMVKFGHFFQTYEDQFEHPDMGNDTFFTLHSCSAVPIERFSEFPKEKDFVVSGSEVFSFIEDESGVNEYYLTSTGKHCSNFNCAYIAGEASKQSVEGCINSAPPGTPFCSVTAALVAGLVAAVMTRL